MMTVPKLRFPEFWEAGKWVEKPIAKICDVLNSRRMPISSNNREKGSYPYYGASGIVDYVSNYIFDDRLLLIGEDGAKWGAFEKSAFIAEGKYWVNNHAHVLKATSINDTLLENYLNMLDLTPYITGAAPPKLTLGKLKEIPVPVPSSNKEQQKIADCLASLDELITAQTQKLATVKTHKKGLMQQLFPKTPKESTP
jgi:type I restriction enzyme S subunit